ncbi:hypothetical protein TREMEDRAFT_40062 [Tremella mesenterica DSM 1558]|uniref:uncharacterized protein n=1 Tax=Tremella mesenterica (strain ATCC 24925 / CBS 8224 / DSM 1558 / NBRC 9311 / NRRL Y-6157 / RJB 2259-6 / UBC 559-6) TaxID=578456 RepID=UPI0003F48BF5|nr:uncharacterized protein TREMEDRAFT_40062 [Tremella mesenterica DSM 1558]EIW67915.1 hypothetical protein TREMEDRAFT_40062 [Tremella mesenterica DSM 1558]
MKMFVLSAVLAASTVLAHFTLDYPTSRGFSDDDEPKFCGGFNDVETRQPFPLTQAPIWIDSHHTTASVVAFISTSETPTSFDDFNKTSNGTSIPLLTNFFQVHEGEYCWNVDFSSLNIGLTNGSLVTLQIQFDGGDGFLFQCTDLVLLSDFTPPSNVNCTSNEDAVLSSGSVTASGGPSATATSSGAPASSSAPSASSAAASSSSTSGAGRINVEFKSGALWGLGSVLAWAML